MRDDSTATAGQGGSSKSSLLADPTSTHREDSTEDAVQAPALDGTINRSIAHADRS
jgi:hypothetical protein